MIQNKSSNLFSLFTDHSICSVLSGQNKRAALHYTDEGQLTPNASLLKTHRDGERFTEGGHCGSTEGHDSTDRDKADEGSDKREVSRQETVSVVCNKRVTRSEERQGKIPGKDKETKGVARVRRQYRKRQASDTQDKFSRGSRQAAGKREKGDATDLTDAHENKSLVLQNTRSGFKETAGSTLVVKSELKHIETASKEPERPHETGVRCIEQELAESLQGLGGRAPLESLCNTTQDFCTQSTPRQARRHAQNKLNKRKKPRAEHSSFRESKQEPGCVESSELHKTNATALQFEVSTPAEQNSAGCESTRTEQVAEGVNLLAKNKRQRSADQTTRQPKGLISGLEAEHCASRDKTNNQPECHPEGIKVQRSAKGRRVRAPSHLKKRRKARGGTRCGPGLYCIHCGAELLPDIQGVLVRAACRSEGVVNVLKTCSGSGEARAWCGCASGRTDSELEDNSTLLLLETNPGLQHLKHNLQVYEVPGTARQSMQTGLSLNAIWNSKDCSVTSYFQCRSCLTKEQAHCYLMGAEILDLRANAKQQIWLIPSAVQFCSSVGVPCKQTSL
ncbi:uncharacterized protein LOC117963269 [Acipenser ruthenus]|uniref:uncharacterized protein LOC117963269 n=1 Tax=Acipenser ruthenus TaxID=7906 RepID=UPI002742278E|nr:uncharacterized protein LOC117963269 [Acipenser ruthenus]